MPRIHKKRTGESPYHQMCEKISFKREQESIQFALDILTRVGLLNIVGERDGESLYQMNQFGRDLRIVFPTQKQFEQYVNLIMIAMDAGIDDPALAWSHAIDNATRDEIARAMETPFRGDDEYKT